MKKINKVIVKEYVKFYYKCLTRRNKIHNDPVKQRVRLKRWAEKLIEMAKKQKCKHINKQMSIK